MYRFARVSVTALAVSLIGGAALGQQSVETYTYDALGRLIVASTGGGQHDGESHSICYDSADNRTRYKSTGSGGTAACIDTGVATPTPSPSPAPTPTPTNSPPQTSPDYATVDCGEQLTVSLTVNDTDPEGNLPLVLQSIVKTSGAAMSAQIVSASSVSLAPFSGGTRQYTYTVADSAGATAQGTLTVTVPSSNCGL